MTVQVRSMKMTRSLFNQMVMFNPSVESADDYRAIGWVFIKDKFIIVQNRIDLSLYKARPIRITGKSQDGRSVHFKSGQRIGTINFQSLVEVDRFISLNQRLIAESLAEGQIFL